MFSDFREEDLDSGKGPSLSHSPNSHLGDEFAMASDSDDGGAPTSDEIKVEEKPSELL